MKSEFNNKISKEYIVHKAIFILAVVTVIAIFIDMTISIYEFINVGLLNHIEDYPWGKVEKEYWNYETPQIYSNWALTTSLCSLGVLILNFFPRKKPIYILIINTMYLITMGYLTDCIAEERSIDQDKLRTTLVLRQCGLSTRLIICSFY